MRGERIWLPTGACFSSPSLIAGGSRQPEPSAAQTPAAWLQAGPCVGRKPQGPHQREAPSAHSQGLPLLPSPVTAGPISRHPARPKPPHRRPRRSPLSCRRPLTWRCSLSWRRRPHHGARKPPPAYFVRKKPGPRPPGPRPPAPAQDTGTALGRGLSATSVCSVASAPPDTPYYPTGTQASPGTV